MSQFASIEKRNNDDVNVWGLDILISEAESMM
jgi:hypothetical protein